MGYHSCLEATKTPNSIPDRFLVRFRSLAEYLLFLGTGGGIASFERQNSSIFWSIHDDMWV